MDFIQMHIVATVLSFFIFIGIIWWALTAKSQKGFNEAAELPFADDDSHLPNSPGEIK